MQRFGEKVRDLRKRQKMTLTELARALGYDAASSSYLSVIETGKKKPRAEFILKVAQFFHVPADVLMDDDLDLPPG
jgi:transcriptional regulator with XRE-family HTH domain